MSNQLKHILLIAFVATGTITAETCSFCPKGDVPPNPGLVVFILEDGNVTTCMDLVDEVSSAPIETCNMQYDQEFAFLCECEGTKPGGACPGLCEDGDLVTLSDDPSGLDGFTCYVLDKLLLGTTDSTQCDRFATSPFRETCGCAPKCTFCPDGNLPTVPSLPSGEKFPFLEGLCEIEIDATSGGEPNCVDQIETGFALLCGCPNAKPPSDAVGCTLCADGKLSDPTRVIPDTPYTCESYNVLISIQNQQGCDEVQVSGEAYACGCPGVLPPSAPVTNAPVGLDTNAPVVGDSNAPVVGDSNAPVVGDSNAPVVGDSNAPVFGDSNAPVFGDSNAPVVGDSNAPVVGDSNAPVIGAPTLEDNPLTGAPVGTTTILPTIVAKMVMGGGGGVGMGGGGGNGMGGGGNGMGGGGGNGMGGNGMKMMKKFARRQLRLSGLREILAPRTTRGRAM